ncbi:MAG: PQQ-binding-like beta-propeller repeat protein [Melioribacteraceae bacterium]|nr:PQQ-binding-like beta-propeller repeat protein [Melioribacteraceae bacterium]MCF8356554.1 PQQ-binding-like beta-propeller repeat protein [Melioribacteraceae bacterium]MCF8394213.1 PQQ-binding-like beta-propeller repeat protein [Melioribacteraceae bacterium]MCF8419933.1 PQQ-binding-like beta-propeller repeat protein [Melioribacteraceae bacterium]
MKTKLLFISFILGILFPLNAQELKLLWVINPRIPQNSEQLLRELTRAPDYDLLITTGNITGNGSIDNFEISSEFLKRLQFPYELVPGNDDIQLSGTSNARFREYFRDDRFLIEKNDLVIIGLNSSLPWITSQNHFAVEDLKWLEKELSTIPKTREIFIFLSNSYNDEIMNWYKLNNLLKDHNVRFILSSGAEISSSERINEIPVFKFADKNSTSLIEIINKPDSVTIRNLESKTTDKFRKSFNTEPVEIDTSGFKNYETEVLWKKSIGFTMEAPIIKWRDFIYAADKSGLITCLDFKGKVIWEYLAFGDIIRKPVVADGYFAAATVQGDLVTLNAFTGEPIQTIGFNESITSSPVVFNYDGDPNLMIPKASESKAAIVIGTESGKIYCYDLETLQQIWVNNNAENRVTIEPLYEKNKIVFNSWDGTVYCVDALSGSLIWKWRNSIEFDENPVECTPVTDGNKVFLAARDGYVYSIDLLLGSTIWRKKGYDPWSSVGISQDLKTILVKGKSNKFHILSARNGNWVREVPVRFGNDNSPFPPLDWDKKIFIGSENGKVYRINEKHRYMTILFMGDSPVNSVINLNNNIYAASNIDGEIVTFKFD